MTPTNLVSPFGRLFHVLQEFISTEVPEIRWIDLEAAQLENYGDRPAVGWPCLLIDFIGFKFEDAGEAWQESDGIVRLRLAFPPFSNTNSKTPIAYKEQALKYYEIEDKLFRKLHAQKLDKFGYLLRRSATTEQRDGDAIRVRLLDFMITFEDTGAMPVYQKGRPSEEIEFTSELVWPSEPEP